MKILGINFGHDSSVALIVNGKLINAIEEEKVSRIKQDFGWPKKSINFILSENKIKPSEIDLIVFGGGIYNHLRKNEIKYRFTKNKYRKLFEILDRSLAYFKIKTENISHKNKLVFTSQLKNLGFINAKIDFYNHHLCHAITAYYCSPFDVDLVLTADGHGDGQSLNFYVNGSDNNLSCIKSNDYKSSIGQFYSAITELLGFKPTRHEGKITGLAAFGSKTDLVDKFKKLFSYNNGILERYPYGDLDKNWADSRCHEELDLKAKINIETSESKVGTEYSKRGFLLLKWLKDNTQGYSKEDIAFACQNVTEYIILTELDIIYNEYFKNDKIKIALAGGVFANVRVNQKIYEKEYIDNIFIQPAMGDSGLALGAAINASYINNSANNIYFTFNHAFHGPNYDSSLKLFVDSLNKEYDVSEMQNPAKQIAKLLSENKIIGFWNGSMEWGPRALGSRSILLNTFDTSVNDTLNKRLNRTEFMPFAPAVLDSLAKKYFPKYKDNVPAGDYMTITYDVDQKYHEELQAVVHVDGTARPQIVNKNTSPYYYKIIEEFFKLTGCGAIVNTSFNAHEEPIVSTAEVALGGLANNRVDVLILENYLIKK